MKKIILLLLIITIKCYAYDYSYFCSSDNVSKTTSGILMSTSGTNFLARSIAKREIERALKKETGSKFKVNIKSFWGANIAKGEFNKFTAKTKKYSQNNFSAQNIVIESLCPYNKVSYQDNKLNFDSNMVLKYNAEMNQDDLSQTLKQKISIVNDKLVFDYKVSAFGIKTTLNLTADVKIEDNKIKLCNINLNNKSIKTGRYLSILDNLTNFNIDISKSTKANIKIDSVKIKNSIIYISGFIFIPKS